MEVYQIILIIIGVIAAVAVIGLLMSVSARKKQYAGLLASFGRLKESEFTYEEYESISHFFRNTLKPGEVYIDDITWNDLDMDRIFMMVNNTNSSVGRDALYKILRRPQGDASALE